MTDRPDIQRSLGLLGATGVGVGAIVGGGILALAGVAFAATGPSAIVAFALNGLIAVLTVLSFAELATQFPESGGTYAFAKKVLTVEAAFSVGWVVWFASIVAAVLYAFGFGAFVVIALDEVHRSLSGKPPDWLVGRSATVTLAVLTTTAIVIAVLVLVPNIAAIGAASSLVFLVTFALAHRITVMARRRGGVAQPYFRTPWFPLVPSAGTLACAALAVFQGINVPTAGMTVCVWLALGGVLYASLFARRARTMDAYSQALDAELVRLRGRSPLVLVPIANPYNAAAMVGVATALATPKVGRVILLSIVSPPSDWQSEETPPSLEASQSVIRGALTASFARGLAPEALTTVSADPWSEIARVVRVHGCESLLLGLSSLTEPGLESRLEALMGQVDCDVAILRAPPGWLLRNVRRVLVPLGGRGGHDELRARLLASIHRLGARETTLLRVLPSTVPPWGCERAAAVLRRLAKDEVPGAANPVVIVADDVAEEVTQHAADADLVVLGLKRLGQRRKVFGDLALRIARETNCGIIMIGRRG